MNNSWKKFLIDDHSEVKRLDYVMRYSSIPAVFQESVSQHTFWVLLHSVLLHRELTQSSNITDPSIEIFIFRKALIHDIGECVTGDVVRTFKYSSVNFKEAVDEAEDAMVQKYLPDSIKSLMLDSNSKNPQDAKYVDSIVKAADFISLFNYMKREHNRGNQEINPFLNKMREDLFNMHLKAKDAEEWYQTNLSDLYLSMHDLATHKEELRSV